MKKKRKALQNLSLSALLSAVLILSALLCLPIGDSRISLQLLAVLLIGGLLPLKYAILSILCYLTLGALGLPVFAGFAGGVGILFGPTGGFLMGFLPVTVVFSLVYRRTGQKRFFPLAALLSLAVCYLCGGLWYLFYTPDSSLPVLFSVCILPYLLPDLLKILLAGLILHGLSRRRVSADQSEG